MKRKTPNNRDWLALLVSRTKYRAKKIGVPFDLVVEDIHIPERCPVLGIPLKHCIGPRGFSDYAPSLDRIIPRFGYVRGNVRIVSARANRIRYNATPAELELVALDARRLSMMGAA